MSAELLSVLAVALPALVSGLVCGTAPELIARLPEPEPDEDPEPDDKPKPAGAQPSEVVEGEPEGGESVVDLPDRSEVDADTAVLAGIGRGDTSERERDVKPLYADIAQLPSARVTLVVIGSVFGGLVGGALGWQPALVAWTFVAAVGTILGWIDLRTRYLPTRIIAPSYGVLAALLLLAGVLDRDIDALIRSGLGWLAFGGFFVVLWLIYPGGLGYGDVRLSGLLGLALGYVGWPDVLLGAYAGLLLGGVVGGLLSVLRVFDRKHYPFGPFMLAGAVVALYLGDSVAQWWTG